jgi:ribokinase
MQLETPLETIALAASIAAQNGVNVILNPAPAQPLEDALLQNISIITPNESEAELLTGIAVIDEPSAKKAAKALHGRGVATVIITLGARGAFVSSDPFTGMVPSFEVSPVDTTAAGDVFNGALAVALSEDVPLQQAVRLANAAAALSVTILGAQPSAPLRRDIEVMLRH